MILLDMSKRSNRWSVYTSDDLFSTKEVIPTSYDKITYNVTSSAIIYSIAETAKANNLKPYEYFEYLLTQIPAHMDDTDRSFLEDLLPWSPKLPEYIRKQKDRG